MLVGKAPFQGKGEELINKINKEQPPAPSSLNEDVYKELDSLVFSCMAKNKKDRYPNIANLKNDLTTIINHHKSPSSK
jgi:serine/threonine protein kinase